MHADVKGTEEEEEEQENEKKKEKRRRRRSVTFNFETQIRCLTSVGMVSRLERWTKESFPPENLWSSGKFLSPLLNFVSLRGGGGEVKTSR